MSAIKNDKYNWPYKAKKDENEEGKEEKEEKSCERAAKNEHRGKKSVDEQNIFRKCSFELQRSQEIHEAVPRKEPPGEELERIEQWHIFFRLDFFHE